MFGTADFSTPALRTVKNSAKRALHRARNRPAISLTGGAILVVLIFIAGAIVYVEVPAAHQSVNNALGVSSTSTTSGVAGGNQPGKIVLYINDPLAGSGNNAPTDKIYPASGVTVGGQTYSGTTPSDTPTISSSGTGTTSSFYPQGATLYNYVSLSNYETMYWKFIAPGATSDQISGGVWPQVNIPQMKLPTLSISAKDDAGNAISTNGDINFTTLSETSVSVTFSITNTATNTGYLSYFDPINNVDSCMMVQAKEGGTNVNIVGVSGFASSDGSLNVGTVREYQTDIPDGYQVGATTSSTNPSAPIVPNAYNDAQCGGSFSSASGGITRMTLGSNQVGGTVTFTVTFKQGSLTQAQSCTFTFQVYKYGSLPYSMSNSGSPGPSSATIGSSFVLNVQG